MATTPHRSRTRGNMDAAGTAHILAVFAADLATCCHILPFLPPITRNDKLSERANRLEFSNRDGSEAEPNVKSGKNGNVDSSSQLCRARCIPNRRRSVSWRSPQARFQPPAGRWTSRPRALPARIHSPPGCALDARGVQSGGGDMKIGASDDGA